jgi:hypothetical protein
MARDIEVQNAPPIMANNKEPIEKTEGDRRNGEEVHGRDGFAMIAEKSQPPPTRPGSGSLGVRFIQREMLRSETWKPSIRSSP